MPSLCNGGGGRGDLTSVALLPRMFHPNISTRKQSDMPKWRVIQDNWAVSAKMSVS